MKEKAQKISEHVDVLKTSIEEADSIRNQLVPDARSYNLGAVDEHFSKLKKLVEAIENEAQELQSVLNSSPKKEDE